MQFLAEDIAAAREPTQKELVTWYETHRDQFASPPRISFRISISHPIAAERGRVKMQRLH